MTDPKPLLVGFPLDNRPEDRPEKPDIQPAPRGEQQAKRPASMLVGWRQDHRNHFNTLGQPVRLSPGSGVQLAYNQREETLKSRWLLFHEIPAEPPVDTQTKALYVYQGRSDGAACAIGLTRDEPLGAVQIDAGPVVLISCAIIPSHDGFHGIALDRVTDRGEPEAENARSLVRKWKNTQHAVQELAPGRGGALVLLEEDAALLKSAALLEEHGGLKLVVRPLSRLQSLPPGGVSLIGVETGDAPRLAYSLGANPDLFMPYDRDAQQYPRYVPPPRDPPRASGAVEDPSPYKGLAQLDASAADHELLLHCRREDLDELSQSLEEQALVFFWGLSGVGKSSLLAAGLQWKFSRWQDCFAINLSPGHDPVLQLFRLLRATLPRFAVSDELHREERLRAEPRFIADELRRWWDADPRRRVLIIIDQAEQLFTLDVPPPVRDHFSRVLSELTRLELPGDKRLVRCVLGVRDGYHAALRNLPGFARSYQPRQDELFIRSFGDDPDSRAKLRAALEGPLQLAQRRAALEGPPQLAPGCFGAGVVEEILDGIVGQPAQLPLLQCCASQLWSSRDPDSGVMSWPPDEDKRTTQDQVISALAAHAEHVLSSLSPAQQELALELLVDLVTSTGELALRTPAELVQRRLLTGSVEDVLDYLVDNRLITVRASSVESAEPAYQLTHIALVAHWPRLETLVEAAREERRLEEDLKKAALEHQGKRGDLWTGVKLRRCRDHEAAIRALLSSSEEADQAAIAFLDASIEQEQRALARAATRRRRVRLLAGGALAVLFAIFAVAFVIVRGQRDVARLARERAVTAIALVSARNVLEQDPTLAAMLLRQSPSRLGLPGWTEVFSRVASASLAERELPGGQVSMIPTGHHDWSPEGSRFVTASGKTATIWFLDGRRRPIHLRRPKNIGFAAWSPDGRRIVTTSWGSAHIWLATEGGEPVVLKHSDDALYNAVWSPDGRRIVTVSQDGTARIWQADGRGTPIELKHKSIQYALWSPDGTRLVTVGNKDGARVWSTERPKSFVQLKHAGQVWNAAWSPDGTRLATVSNQSTQIWSVGTWEPVSIIARNGARVLWSPDGKRLAIVPGILGSKGNRLVIVDPEAPGERVRIKHDGEVVAAAWSPDSRLIVSASWDNTARVSTAEGQTKLVLRHIERVSRASWSPDGTRIATTFFNREGQSVRIWPLVDLKRPVVLRHKGRVRSAGWRHDGQRVATSSDDRTVALWDRSGGRRDVLPHHRPVQHAVWHPVDTRVATLASDDQKVAVQIWSPSKERYVSRVLLSPPRKTYVSNNLYRQVVWSPSGRSIAVRVSRTTHIFGPDLSREPITLRHERDRFGPWLTWNSTGTQIATESDGDIHIWSSDGKGRPVVLEHVGLFPVTTAAWSPDGRRILTASRPNIRLWPADTLKDPVKVSGRSLGKIGFKAFWSPDGRQILSVGSKTWIFSTNQRVDPIELKHGELVRVWYAAWSPDGKRIVTCGTDRNAHIWLANGTRQMTLPHGGKVDHAEWSPDGSRLVTTSDESVARIWRVIRNPDRELWTRVRGCLAPVLRQQYLLEDKDEAARKWSACEKRIEKSAK